MKKQKLLESPKKQLGLKRNQKLGQKCFIPMSNGGWSQMIRLPDLWSLMIVLILCSMHQMEVKQCGFLEKQNLRRLETYTDEHHEAKNSCLILTFLEGLFKLNFFQINVSCGALDIPRSLVVSKFLFLVDTFHFQYLQFLSHSVQFNSVCFSYFC